jgi:hypothetical protein
MTPKPFIDIMWQGTTMPMIEHVVHTVPWELIHVVAAVPPRYKCSRGWVQIVDTKGPAETTKKVLESIGPQSCLIMDSDILNSTNDLSLLTELRTGIGVLVSRSANPAFSYVDKLHNFSRIKEKERISEYAVRGAYFVAPDAVPQFMTILGEVCEGYSEPYLSHVFDLMICEKEAQQTLYTPIDWGTPRDVKLSGARIVLEGGETHVYDKCG